MIAQGFDQMGTRESVGTSDEGFHGRSQNDDVEENSTALRFSV